MTVVAPPHGPGTKPDRDLEQRVADLEALIEEAHRRARRRRMRRGAAALLLVAAGAAAFFGFGGQGGGGASTAGTAHARVPRGSTASAESLPLGALPPGAGFVDAFAFDSRRPQTVYVLTSGHVFKSADSGSHWHAVASGWVGANEALAADPRHPGTLYAGTAVAVYKTVDSGRSWQPSHRGLFVPPAGAPQHRRSKGWVIAVAVDPVNTDIVYAGSDRVSKSTDGGQSWTTAFPPRLTPYRDTVSALAIAPTHQETIYAIVGDFAKGLTSIIKSTDDGTTWLPTEVVRGTNAVGFDTALAVDPQQPSTVYAAIGGRVLKTTDAGESWRPITAGLASAVGLPRWGVTTLAIDPQRTGTVYAALSQGGIFKTTNGGQTWIPASPGGLYMYTVAVDPVRPTTIYAAGESETGDGPQILRSTNGGRTWAAAA